MKSNGIVSLCSVIFMASSGWLFGSLLDAKTDYFWCVCLSNEADIFSTKKGFSHCWPTRLMWLLISIVNIAPEKKLISPSFSHTAQSRQHKRENKKHRRERGNFNYGRVEIIKVPKSKSQQFILLITCTLLNKGNGGEAGGARRKKDCITRDIADDN